MFKQKCICTFLFCFLLIEFAFSYSIKKLIPKKNVNLNQQISKLQTELTDLRKNHVELYMKVDSIIENLNFLNSCSDEFKEKFIYLNQFIQDIEVVLNKNDNVTLPSFVYKNAYSDYLIKKYDIAHSEFKSFVDKYPKSEFCSLAQFYIAECLYFQNFFENAVYEYKKFEEVYPTSDLIPSARLKQSMCYEMLNKQEESLKILTSIVKDFPKKNETLIAIEKIKLYENIKNN
jgi:TolA-binding protein